MAALTSARNKDNDNDDDDDDGDQCIHPLLLRVASPDLLPDDALRDMANVINTALVHFAIAKS